MDNGVEQILDRELKEKLRGQARRVYLESILVGLVLTVLVLLIPA